MNTDKEQGGNVTFVAAYGTLNSSVRFGAVR